MTKLDITLLDYYKHDASMFIFGSKLSDLYLDIPSEYKDKLQLILKANSMNMKSLIIEYGITTSFLDFVCNHLNNLNHLTLRLSVSRRYDSRNLSKLVNLKSMKLYGYADYRHDLLIDTLKHVKKLKRLKLVLNIISVKEIRQIATNCPLIETLEFSKIIQYHLESLDFQLFSEMNRLKHLKFEGNLKNDQFIALMKHLPQRIKYLHLTLEGLQIFTRQFVSEMVSMSLKRKRKLILVINFLFKKESDQILLETIIEIMRTCDIPPNLVLILEKTITECIDLNHNDSSFDNIFQHM